MTINYITGYAGTGKSTRLLDLINSIELESSVVICPTHKAIKRLFDSPRYPIMLEIKTIHALLGWVPTINEQATQVGHIDVTIKLDKPIDSYTHIIIDEGGMMSEDMLMEITSKLEEANNFETEHIVIDIFLDPYQLLPVKGKQIQIDPTTTVNLTTQYRSESPDVVALFTKFVEFIEGTNKRDLKIEPSENVHFIDKIPYFNPDTDRLLAYTNDCVGYYNMYISKLLGITTYEGQEVQLGNVPGLFIVDEFYKPSLEELLMAYESGSLKLQNSAINKKFLEYSLQALIDCRDIDFIISNEQMIPVVVGIDNANRVRKQAKQLAIENKHNFKWLYALDRAFTMDYKFASTVHKAQGSEFDRVFIVKNDIMKSIMNNYYETYARLMYVAISRARQKVFIL